MCEVSRQSEWTCRVPVEVFTRILSMIALDDQVPQIDVVTADTASSNTSSDDNASTSDTIPFIPTAKPTAAHTLGRIQSTSSALYSVTTPFLYRELRLSTPQLINLLRLFGGIYNTHEVIDKAPDGIKHPLDLGLYHRLRWALSFVETIDLNLDPYFDRRLFHRVRSYADISTVLQVMKLPTLWPRLDRVTIKVRERKSSNDPEGVSEYLSVPYESRLVSLIGPTLRPTHLIINLPDQQPGKNYAARYANWACRPTSVLRDMCADHVTVTNLYEIGQGVPRASKSLEISFAVRAGEVLVYNPADFSRGALGGRQAILVHLARGVPNLTVVGFERGLGDIPVEEIEAALESTLGYLADGRDEFRYRIKPWTSSEPGDWDVWHSVDEEFGRQ